MTRKRSHGNGDGDVWPRRNKEGKIIGYRGAYVGPDGKRRYVSGKTKEETQFELRRARANADQGLVFDAQGLKFSEYLERWLDTTVRGASRTSLTRVTLA